ncbi:MAG: nucleotide-binding protein [Nitrospira sp.]|nr:nucleotide-binding protein [Nitrospira sp.]
MTRPPKAKAIERLRRAMDAIPELKQLQYNSPEFKKWKRDTQVTLRNTFEDNSSHLNDFNNISFFPATVSIMGRTPSTRFQHAYLKGLDSATAVLKSMIEEVEEYWEDESETQIPSNAQANDGPSTKEIFVVHGRDKDTKNTVARFLEKLELTPVILAEIPGKGRTIIEKFEQHAQVGFAIVLLTPDDAGSLQGDNNNLSPRARQNVIFELGFFIGRLGRKRVCALTKGGVEIPSDYAGIEYITLDDSGGWQSKLIQELKGARIEFDANLAFQA